ncbi:MAG: hypothetical protein LBR54_03940 [Oscillospiraceae bacterium]|nr:hypothetical protein [Oscillospiraceae bacterium]
MDGEQLTLKEDAGHGGIKIEKKYKVPFEMFEQSFKDFQKKYVYPLVIVQAAIYALVLALAVWRILQQQTFYYMFMAIALGMGISVFIRPKLTRRKVMLGVRGIENDVYRFRLYDDRITLLYLNTEKPAVKDTDESAPQETAAEKHGDESAQEETAAEKDGGTKVDLQDLDVIESAGETVLRFDNANFKVIEFDSYFMLYQTRAMYYTVPKFAFTDSEIEMLRAVV